MDLLFHQEQLLYYTNTTTTNMTFEEVLTSIKSTFKSYNAAGLIDDIDVYGWYVESVKPFGALPFELHEEVLEVTNGQAKLPTGFRKLVLALKCEPFSYSTKHKDHLQSARFWKERHEKSALWDNCDDCCITESEKFIVERLYYRTYECDYYYKNPTPLRLTQGINRKMCTTDCANLTIKQSPYEINIIKGNILQTNFTTGNVFIRYRGFEEDEDGFVIIPDSFNGYLEDYVKDYIKAKIMESIIANGDATGGEQSLLGFYLQSANDNETRAMTELKANGFDSEARRNYKKRLARERKKFELMF